MPQKGNILNIFAQTGLKKVFSQFLKRELALASFKAEYKRALFQ
ncbi:MAG: hypothetical protein Q7S39_12965 [Ignavibacteria bacterium]|nr:hypothetical protein [Ignavibacteria bacterium]